ncbi:MAG: prefoldin subunit alpha [Candidatus Woesearchaeota archaeon]
MAQNNNEQQHIQQRYMEFQALQEQIKEITEHLEKISSRIEEVGNIINNVGELSELKDDTEILVPISNGIFINAKSIKKGDFLVNVGGKTVVNKNKDQVIELLKKQKQELTELQINMANDLENLEVNAKNIQKELEAIMG